MPLHDWTPLPAGLFHHFHQDWSIEIARVLNRERLPKGYSALVEQCAGPRDADLIAIESGRSTDPVAASIATADRPRTSIIRRAHREFYAAKANRIVIRHQLGRVVAVVEIVLPGNKDSRRSLKEFVDKTMEFLLGGVHVLVVDVFPPGPRDPQGIHKAIWDEIVEEDFVIPEGKDRILVSYEAGNERVAYVEPIGPGDDFPDMPLFLNDREHVSVPLERTYGTTWEASPEALRSAVESGSLPDGDGG
jgi:hypothetical protein